MKEFYCNEVKFPEFPSNYKSYKNYLICIYTGTAYDCDYCLLLYNGTFCVIESKIGCWKTDALPLLYFCKKDGTGWVNGIITEDGDSTTQIGVFNTWADYFWSNNDIYDVNSGDIVYDGTNYIIKVVADVPRITSSTGNIANLINSNKSEVVNLGDKVRCMIRADAKDVGTLDYIWYEDDVEVFRGEDFYPPTNDITNHVYRFVVVNTLNDTVAILESKNYTLTVLARDIGIELTSAYLGWLFGKQIRNLQLDVVASRNNSYITWDMNQETLELNITDDEHATIPNNHYLLIGDTLNIVNP